MGYGEETTYTRGSASHAGAVTLDRRNCDAAKKRLTPEAAPRAQASSLWKYGLALQ
jgi:hypothetical protein